MISVVTLIERRALANHGNFFEVLLASVRALHGAENTRRARLHGQMHVVAQGRDGIDGVDDIGAEIARVRSHETHAANSRHVRDGEQQLRRNSRGAGEGSR